MDLATGRMIRRAKVIACAMTHLVVERVEELAARQGYKSLKFFNRKREEMILRNADLLEGVGVSSEPLEDEDYQELPPIDDGIQNDSDDSDGELDVDDEQVDQEELADLLEDAKEVLNAPEAEEESNEEGGRPVNDGVENEPEEENNEEINCDGNMSEQASRSGEDTPSLVSEPEERVKRVSQRPERYNPSTGMSYAQVEYTHNITAQVEDEKKTLEYHESETGIVANIITRLKNGMINKIVAKIAGSLIAVTVKMS